MEANYVVKINTALSNKPFWVKIANPKMSVDSIVTEAVDTLRNSGKPLESQQLADLYKSHQIYNNGKTVDKGSFFDELPAKTQVVGDQSVDVLELDLISTHSGG